MRVALFPGQGVSSNDVAASLPAGDPLVERASEVLGYDLRKKVLAHSRAKALPTWLSQPAIYVGGMVAHMDSEAADVYLGHSVGEFTALAAAGAMSFDTGLELLRERGHAMQVAAQRAPGGMLAVLKLDDEDVSAIAREAGVHVANLNAPGQVVLSGGHEALSQASGLVRARGGRAVLLGVTGPFHSPAMAPAAEALSWALARATIRMPSAPVISNVTARPYRAPGEIRRLLVSQMTGTVHFRQCLEWVQRCGVSDFHDLGPGHVVGGLAERTFASATKEVAHV
ncbi:MAG: ACP S-malonyltransferase [Actinomycetota bacterium]